MTTLTAHQPNFLPWLPFFEKISSADIHVHLENVQFEKNNFQNRFQIENVWQTMSVVSGMVPIKEKQYANPVEDWEKISNRLPQYASKLASLSHLVNDSLALTNIGIIESIVEKLGITTRLVRDFPTAQKSTDRLIELCKHFDADVYLSGPSGRNYLEFEKFKIAGIELIFFEDSTTPKVTSLERI